MNEEKIYPFEETTMYDLITDFKEYSTDYTKTACEYYEEYLRNYQKEKLQLQNNWNELKKGLRSLYDFDEGVVSKDYLECVEDTLEKMQELENSNNGI